VATRTIPPSPFQRGVGSEGCGQPDECKLQIEKCRLLIDGLLRARLECQYFAPTLTVPCTSCRRMVSFVASKSVHGWPLTVTLLIDVAFG
jgi:hypothetical protein